MRARIGIPLLVKFASDCCLRRVQVVWTKHGNVFNAAADIMHCFGKVSFLPMICHLGQRLSILLKLAVFILPLGIMACTFHGDLREDFHQPPISSEQGQKLPLRAILLVEAQNIQASGAFGVGVDIALRQGITKAVQSELATVFEEVTLADATRGGSKGDIIVRAKFRNKVLVNTMAGTADTKWELEFDFRESLSKAPVSKLLLKEQTHYSPSGRMYLASVITGLCMFVCLPLTAPWMANIAGDDTLELIEGAISEELRKLPAAIRDDHKILAFARGEQPGSQPTVASIQSGNLGVTANEVDIPPSAAPITRNNAYAIVIGIEKYRGQIPPADYAARDARIVAKYLTKSMGFLDENVMVLLDQSASRADFEKYFEAWLPNNLEKGGSIFIYYSGHGAPNPTTGAAYLVPYDGDATFLEKTGYSLKRLYAQLDKLPAKDITVVLDSCFSGAGGRSILAEGARPMVLSAENALVGSGKTVVLAASSGAQISSTYKDKGHGLLTYYFLKGLQGEGDLNRDGVIDMGELYEYLKPNVQRVARKYYNNEQIPQLLASPEILHNGGGRLIEASRP